MRRRELAQWPKLWKQDAPWPTPREVGDLGWHQAAACRDADDVTSERLVEASRFQQVADLVASLCGGCPVAAHCLRAGQEGRADGTWGGLVLRDGRERVRPRRRDQSGSGAGATAWRVAPEECQPPLVGSAV